MHHPQLPSTLTQRLIGYRWSRDTLGESGANTFRLQGANEVLYLKTAVSPHTASLQAEAQRIQWLNGRLPVPQLLEFAVTEEGAYLLMTAVPGVNLTSCNDKTDSEKETAVRLLAEGLHQLHSLPLAACPFNHRLEVQIEKARQRVIAGLVDEDDFDEERWGRPTADLFQELLATRPAEEDVVFTHGDYCLPNVMVENGRLSGFIDVGNAGLADRYQDLALCTRSLAYNFGAGWEKLFWQCYGVSQPDNDKLAFYRLLDEFF
ncbi:MAG: aminoglycoside 3'-phosphotransferase [Ardenticatenaceae bacterium]|nr:aminoglycoside 3'-phosphotransferase [Ardenticatenaceae bacterium]